MNLGLTLSSLNTAVIQSHVVPCTLDSRINSERSGKGFLFSRIYRLKSSLDYIILKKHSSYVSNIHCVELTFPSQLWNILQFSIFSINLWLNKKYFLRALNMFRSSTISHNIVYKILIRVIITRVIIIDRRSILYFFLKIVIFSNTLIFIKGKGTRIYSMRTVPRSRRYCFELINRNGFKPIILYALEFKSFVFNISYIALETRVRATEFTACPVSPPNECTYRFINLAKGCGLLDGNWIRQWFINPMEYLCKRNKGVSIFETLFIPLGWNNVKFECLRKESQPLLNYCDQRLRNLIWLWRYKNIYKGNF